MLSGIWAYENTAVRRLEKNSEEKGGEKINWVVFSVEVN